MRPSDRYDRRACLVWPLILSYTRQGRERVGAAHSLLPLPLGYACLFPPRIGHPAKSGSQGYLFPPRVAKQIGIEFLSPPKEPRLDRPPVSKPMKARQAILFIVAIVVPNFIIHHVADNLFVVLCNADKAEAFNVWNGRQCEFIHRLQKSQIASRRMP